MYSLNLNEKKLLVGSINSKIRRRRGERREHTLVRKSESAWIFWGVRCNFGDPIKDPIFR